MKRALPVILALTGFAVFAVLWIVTDRRASQRVYDRYSSANTSDHGLSLAAGYLGRQRKVVMLTRPLGRKPIERNATVFRLADERPTFFDPEDLKENQVGPPRPKRRPLLSDADEEFVRAGGRVIIASTLGVFDSVDVTRTVARKVFPVWPAVHELQLGEFAGAYPAVRPRMLPLFASGTAIVIARERIGAGELFVFSAPELLQNANIAANLALLEALAGEGRPVYFDEVMHGIAGDDGALTLMKEWNLGPFLLLLALIAILVFWRHGRRIGPAEDDHRDTRSEAVDLVQSIGALYQEVTPDSDAIAVYHDALTRTVAHSTGLRGEALHKRVDDLTGGLVPPTGGSRMPTPIFMKQLTTLNEAFQKSEVRRVKSER
jgi:hypothetical protein